MLTAQVKNGNVIATCVFVTEKVLLKVVKRQRSFFLFKLFEFS